MQQTKQEFVVTKLVLLFKRDNSKLVRDKVYIIGWCHQKTWQVINAKYLC